MNNLPTVALLRKRLNARRRLATESSFAKVISGSATRRSSLALGRVVLMSSCSNSELVIFWNMALRWLLVRPNLTPLLRCRMVKLPLNFNGYGKRSGHQHVNQQVANFQGAYQALSL